MKFNYLPVALAALAATAIGALPQAANAEPFKGEYLGVQGGVAITRVRGDTLTGTLDDTAHKPVVIALGGYRGTLWSDSQIILGIEGDIGFLIDEFDSRYSISGIAGYNIDDRALIYGRVGFASLSDADPNLNENVEGLMLGGGAEMNVFSRINFRIDYRNIDYGASAPDLVGNTLNLRGHEVTGGVIFDF